MAEIKISELSIGDWVVLENQPFKVIGINPPYVDLLGNGNRLRLSDIDNDNLSPIPLTPEILEKNGFIDYEVGKGWYVLNNVADDLRVWLHRNSHDWTFQLMKWSPLSTHEIGKVFINHTHQLQHALRLAGVGKEIEL